eukprot:TRINITY_DN42180_c0_g1_i1.p1 TRINITY_DN42180_c0_g1~~TRINITY_DN42180_c0_g1_i1.p1  ORF type:complete len:373 (+),score=69.85 TRINITY_DN42180_c0_g1_i1:37-1119(+)
MAARLEPLPVTPELPEMTKRVLNNKIMQVSSKLTPPSDVLIMIKQRRGSVNERYNDSLETPLHVAAMKGNNDLAVSLMRAGMKAGKKDVWGNTPLTLAIKNDDLQMVKAIVEVGRYNVEPTDLTLKMTVDIRKLLTKKFLEGKEVNSAVIYGVVSSAGDRQGMEAVLEMVEDNLTEDTVRGCVLRAAVEGSEPRFKMFMGIALERGYKIAFSDGEAEWIATTTLPAILAFLLEHSIIPPPPAETLFTLCNSGKLHICYLLATVNPPPPPALLKAFLLSPSYTDICHLSFFESLVEATPEANLAELCGLAKAHGYTKTVNFLEARMRGEICAANSESIDEGAPKKNRRKGGRNGEECCVIS